MQTPNRTPNICQTLGLTQTYDETLIKYEEWAIPEIWTSIMNKTT